MRILPVSFNKFNQTHQNFTGVSREISKEYVGTGDFGGEQGDYIEYLRTVEYRPFADETPEEIQRNVKKLEQIDVVTPEPHAYTYPSGYKVYRTSDLINTKVIIGEPLQCTKEEARLVIEESKKADKN